MGTEPTPPEQVDEGRKLIPVEIHEPSPPSLEPVIAKISQETLAEMIGTTRSRVSAFMNKFRKLGFIEYNRDLKVHNSLLNVILHDVPGVTREAEDA